MFRVADLVPLLSAVIEPSPNRCYTWDTTYINYFNALLFLAILFFIVLFAFLPRVRRWIFTRPYARVLVASLAFPVFCLLITLPAWWTSVLSLFRIPEEYTRCVGPDYDAPGFFWGLIGKGVSAIAQPLTMLAIFAAIWALVVILGFLVNWVAARRGWWWGIPRPRTP